MTPEERKAVHKPDVAAVLELVMQAHLPVRWNVGTGEALCICDATLTFEGPIDHRQHVAEKQKEALTAADYAVVKLPEGVAVEHGARLVRFSWGGVGGVYAIEATP